MNIVIESSIHTLKKSERILASLTNVQLSDQSVSPYYSCVGSHIRHILDFYDCILEGIESKQINLINRKRDELMHCNCDYALDNVSRVIQRIGALDQEMFHSKFTVTDDLGLGTAEIEYSLGAILAQANSHAIHHYAIISYILDRLNVVVEDASFGYNPTTPKPQVSN